MPPLFSIVMPIYNTESYLQKAVDSILTQNFDDYELILIDDGSTDSCPAIVDEYAEKDKRVRVFHRPNGGAYSATNLGIEEATGKYVIIANSDDYLDEKALEILAEQANEYDYDVIYINVAVHVCDKEQNIIREDIYGNKLTGKFHLIGKKEVEAAYHTFLGVGLAQNSVNVYRTSIMKKYPFATDHYGADYTFNITIADEINSVSCHPAKLYHHFQYVYEEKTERNLSIGTYNDYEHNMFNNFYLGYKKLFKKWGILTPQRWIYIARLRRSNLGNQLHNISAWNNKMTSVQNIVEILSYFDDVLAEAVGLLGALETVEAEIIQACNLQLSNAKGLSTAINVVENPMLKMLYEFSSAKGSALKKAKIILNALFDSDNPYRLGLQDYVNFCKDISKLRNSDELKYLLAERQARINLLACKYDIAAEEIEQLFEMPVSTPEKYYLLALNCHRKGLKDEAVEAINRGFEKFPDNKRLNGLLKQIQGNGV